MGDGGLVGMLAGGFLADQIPIVMMTSLFALLALICIPLIAFTVPHSNVDHRTTAKAMSPTFQFTPYISLILVTSLFKGFLIMGLFASTLSPLIESRMQEPMTIASLMIGAATIAGIVQAIRWCWDPFLAPLIGRWSDRLEKRYTLLFVPLIAGGVLLVVVGFTESSLLLIGLLLLFQLTSTMLTTTVDTLAASAAANTDESK
ncbi:MFS transporter [Geomicrobium sp. JCM 19055]|uniref:MFS transporter n=1 Tax=Geomicrobium sp. JCM 19055 TaxID=1460649 RepID=UPI002235DB71|nr:MFS transporter [Geomicrobium sp. JCM 19055]